ncbi:MAG: hypothetical protein EAZ85_06115 [Bacteroidetes bacterium]|nr:MAG: hypothetical protein EAZ85_06115 [Bacteroidota bacterium]TAG89877.1 MAG: hypothetical protein EAZ20_05490 [Bacteroidota bacterium]
MNASIENIETNTQSIDANEKLSEIWTKLEKSLAYGKIIDYFWDKIFFWLYLIGLLIICISLLFNIPFVISYVSAFLITISSFVVYFRHEKIQIIEKLNFEINVFLDDCVKYKKEYYLNEKNSFLLVESAKYKKYNLKFIVRYMFVVCVSFLFLWVIVIFTRQDEQKIKTLEQENKILKEKIKKLEKK